VRPVETVTEGLAIRARVTPGAIAYTADGEATTYADLLREASQLAGRLAARGVERGDRCAVVLPTGLDFIRSIYASQLLAAIPIAINPELPEQAVSRRVQLVRARLAICEPGATSILSNVAGLPCPVASIRDLARGPGVAGPLRLPEPDDPAFLQLTSGTTGEPRAAVITHRSLVASLLATSERLEIHAGDVLATWVPLHHDLGLVRYIFGAMLSGCPSHVIRPSMGQFRPWLELVARVRATITGGPDSAYRLAARTVDPGGLDLGALRFAGNGGEPVRLATIEAFERRFGLAGVVRPAYGLAEATLTVASTAPGEALRVGERGVVSCGRPLDGIELRVADSNGAPVSTGAEGNILVRGACVFAGYFDNHDATRRVLRDGWLHTGDVGSLDGQGYLFVTGRSRALIKRGGVTIVPREIEDAVNRVPGVTSSAAVGAVLSSLSETEDVVVVAEVGTNALDIGDIVASIGTEVRGAVGFVPGQVVLVPAGSLPRTGAGKVQYDELRRMVMTKTLPALSQSQ
jgi:fatty-acyl-CoA synthase